MTDPLHFWSDFWPGPAAERRKLERSAEPYPFLHPETEEHKAILPLEHTQCYWRSHVYFGIKGCLPRVFWVVVADPEPSVWILKIDALLNKSINTLHQNPHLQYRGFASFCEFLQVSCDFCLWWLVVLSSFTGLFKFLSLFFLLDF